MWTGSAKSKSTPTASLVSTESHYSSEELSKLFLDLRENDFQLSFAMSGIYPICSAYGIWMLHRAVTKAQEDLTRLRGIVSEAIGEFTSCCMTYSPCVLHGQWQLFEASCYGSVFGL